MIATDRNLRCRKNVSSQEFLVGYIGLLLAVFFICVGLSLKTEVRSMSSQQQVNTSKFMACFHDNIDDNYLNNNTRVILMVVDAWRLSHLVDPDSPMIFLRESILSGQAVAFVANVQTPTVTMPRIKALTSGVVPSLISLVTNFFATENMEDNWVNSAAAAGRRIVFFGDDTWLRLFPKAFAVAEGVTSFFVNDYTEVDNNVTRHLDYVLTADHWDLLILHYLGLDHVGHSLGGESVVIRTKLHEMDNIARRIFHTVSARSPLLFVMVGDHGMTNAGSHGGGSEAESRVPLLFFHSKAEVIQHGNLNELPYAEQVDLASTLPFFLRINIPMGSIGLSLVPYIAEHWSFSEFAIFSTFVQQINHFSNFANDSALSRLLNAEEDRHCEAAEVFLTNARSRSTLERNREVQREIIQSEEQIIRWPIFVGLILAVLTFLLFSGLLPFYGHANTETVGTQALDYPALLIFGLYHISSYSTSLIEEEHDIWYDLHNTYKFF
ncbi:hypothetical protein KIN20_007302 [Parelaphostrongylus tenuis]|uniref:GPI ethanolamine phosphate transferase 2 n=1 Tax=Parelaphostrongylus tenuis TaxID=148309 RepID=A0AAD5MNY3_PARTN|nr:hypothetical protein KIN20_007302 [Parelaphostrongylus tenuis]